MVLGTASLFLIRKHQKFSQSFKFCQIYKLSGVNLLEKALRKLSFHLKVKVFRVDFTDLRFKD